MAPTEVLFVRYTHEGCCESLLWSPQSCPGQTRLSRSASQIRSRMAVARCAAAAVSTPISKPSENHLTPVEFVRTSAVFALESRTKARSSDGARAVRCRFRSVACACAGLGRSKVTGPNESMPAERARVRKLMSPGLLGLRGTPGLMSSGTCGFGRHRFK